VELPAELARDRKRLRNIRGLHEAKAQEDPRKRFSDRLNANAFRRINTWCIRGFYRENDVLLMQHLVVLETVQQRSRRTDRVAGEEHGCTGYAGRRFLLKAFHKGFERCFVATRLLEE